MYGVKVREGVFRHVESELELYHETRKEIIRLSNEITSPTHSSNAANGKQLLENYSVLTKLRYLSEMQRFVRSIEHVTENLPAEKREFIKLYYWSKPRPLNLKAIAQQLNCSSRDPRQWQFEIVSEIAHQLGWD